MSDAKNFPAVGLLAVFGLGSAAAAGGLTGSGWLMVQQGLTQDAAAPLATAAVCLGSFLSGLLMALLQKEKGLSGARRKVHFLWGCYFFWAHCTRVSGGRCSSSGPGLSC